MDSFKAPGLSELSKPFGLWSRCADGDPGDSLLELQRKYDLGTRET
jgi:hypothetical protein